MHNAPYRIADKDERDLRVVGESFKIGDQVVTCSGVQWGFRPAGIDDVLPCHSRDAAEACARMHRGEVVYRATYEVRW
jgi:hypothetical protein